jgi:hypothetical protein
VSCWGDNEYGQVILVVCFEGAFECLKDARMELTIVFVCLVQVGDGTTIDRNTPVPVAGLSSGVAMIALGWVRRNCDWCMPYDCEEEGLLPMLFLLVLWTGDLIFSELGCVVCSCGVILF